MKCFEKPLSDDDLENIKQSIHKTSNAPESEKGIDARGFIQLNKMFAEKGRHETIWITLRKFHYTDSLSLKDSFLHPRSDIQILIRWLTTKIRTDLMYQNSALLNSVPSVTASLWICSYFSTRIMTVD
jgi:hypothetical protein